MSEATDYSMVDLLVAEIAETNPFITIPNDIIGKKFGKWFAIADAGTNERQQKFIRCRCDCGFEQDIQASRLMVRGTYSCRMCNVKKHGMEATPTYNTWRCMVARCTQPNNHNYKRYNGRGIFVCERWKTFANFFEDMGVKPEGLQLDRINNDDGYYKENCRWVTPKVNSNNRRKPIRSHHAQTTIPLMSSPHSDGK